MPREKMGNETLHSVRVEEDDEYDSDMDEFHEIKLEENEPEEEQEGEKSVAKSETRPSGKIVMELEEQDETGGGEV